jgi:hypothetical protein
MIIHSTTLICGQDLRTGLPLSFLCSRHNCFPGGWAGRLGEVHGLSVAVRIPKVPDSNVMLVAFLPGYFLIFTTLYLQMDRGEASPGSIP